MRYMRRDLSLRERPASARQPAQPASDL